MGFLSVVVTVTLIQITHNEMVEVCPPGRQLVGDEVVCVSFKDYHFCSPDTSYMDPRWASTGSRRKRQVSTHCRAKNPAEAIARNGANDGWLVYLGNYDNMPADPLAREPVAGAPGENVLILLWDPYTIDDETVKHYILLTTRFKVKRCGPGDVVYQSGNRTFCFERGVLKDHYWVVLIDMRNWVNSHAIETTVPGFCNGIGTCTIVEGYKYEAHESCTRHSTDWIYVSQVAFSVCRIDINSYRETVSEFMRPTTDLNPWKGDCAVDTEPTGPGSLNHVVVRPGLGSVIRVSLSSDMVHKSCGRGCLPTRLARNKRGNGFCVVICFGIGAVNDWKDDFIALDQKMLNNMNTLSTYVHDTATNIAHEEAITRNMSYQNRLYLVGLQSNINTTHIELMKLDVQRVRDKIDNTAKLNVLVKEQNALKLDMAVMLLNQHQISTYIESVGHLPLNLIRNQNFRTTPAGCIRFNDTGDFDYDGVTVVGGMNFTDINTDLPPTVGVPPPAPIFTRGDGVDVSVGEVTIICLSVLTCVCFVLTIIGIVCYCKAKGGD